MKKSLDKILNVGAKAVVGGTIFLSSLLPLSPLLANTLRDNQANQKNIQIESVVKNTINKQLYTDSRAQMPDTLLGLSTQEDKYWVNFKDVYGEDFESTQTPDPLARDGPDEANKLNPYLQPNTNLTDAYGSLDVIPNGFINSVDYSYLVDNFPQIDEADLDGNGRPSEQADIDLAYNYLTGQTDHLPGYGNQITGQEVIDWNTNIAAIDLTDELPDGPDWDCKHYSTQDMLNHGNYAGDDIPDIYDQTNINRFNNKEYMLEFYDKATNMGHMMIAFSTRNGNSDDEEIYMAKEPQTDSIGPLTTVMSNLPNNYRMIIKAIRDFSNPSNPTSPMPLSLLAWDKDSTGIHNIYTHPDLVMSMSQDIPVIEPTLLNIDNENVSVSNSYNLGQNYPNPFNAFTNIEYNLSNKEPVELNIYNLEGRKLENLVTQTQEPGKHNIKFNGSEYSSGTYFYRLQVGNNSKTKKMTLIK